MWVMAARIVQALLAAKIPEGRCARGPSIRSENRVSTMACRRWVMSASATGASLSVRNLWWRQTGNSGSWSLRSLTRRTISRAVTSCGVPVKAV